MKCTIPEISWHNREPVLSVDIYPTSNEPYRLATSGGDSHVLIWLLNLCNNGAVKQELVSDLTKHQRAVNVVRWSPTGQYLASADDDANIIIWQQKQDNIPSLEDDTGDKENWVVYKILRGHKEDIYDLCWSVNGEKLLSGSIDNTAILWDLAKGRMNHILTDHKGFVQGVAWDPKDQLLTTISTDRICRIFATNGKQVKFRIHKGTLPVPSDHYLYKKEVKYFHDDTFKSFFRRLQLSPDGSLLVVPSGHIESDDCKETLNATLVFTLDNFSQPAAILPLKNQSSTAVRFCPVLYELHEDGPNPIVKLPYRMIFAVSTDHDVILYDTQQSTPFARFQDIHYTRLTDLTWSSDGRLLIASSTDGFCALITFDVEELGVPYIKMESESEENVLDVSGCEELEKSEIVKEVSIKEKKRPSFIEQWAIKTPKRIRLDNEAREVKNDSIIEIMEDDEKELSSEIRKEINKLIPRRATQVGSSEKKDDKSVIKPIAVRRKPKIEDAGKPIEVKQKPEVEQPAKLIEVRRKPRILNNVGSKENKPLNTVSSSDSGVQSEIKSEENSVNIKDKVPCPDVIEIMESADEGLMDKNQEKPAQMKLKTKNTKTEEPKKIKPSSSKKAKSTPPKNSPLLKFLKNSAEKKKKAVQKEVACIDLTVAYEEARDAWKCDKDTKENSPNKTNSKGEPMEEDCTEDFCLQLEDTQESEENSNKRKTESNAEKFDNKTDYKEISQVVTPVGTSKDGNDAKSISTTEKAPSVVKMEIKVPRRVPLITLSSPKGKKKPKS